MNFGKSCFNVDIFERKRLMYIYIHMLSVLILILMAFKGSSQYAYYVYNLLLRL